MPKKKQPARKKHAIARPKLRSLSATRLAAVNGAAPAATSMGQPVKDWIDAS
jgi:hypothetical protein